MKSFARLVKNEFIKIFAQTAYKVLLIIMVVLFMLVPLLNKGLTAIVDFIGSFYTIEEDIEYFEDLIAESEDTLEKEYFKVNRDSLKLFFDNGLDYESWQYLSMYYEYLDYCLAERIYFLLSEGEITFDVAKESSFSEHVYENVTEAQYRELYSEFSSERTEYEALIINSEISDYYQKIYDDMAETKSNLEFTLGQLRLNSLDDVSAKYGVIICEKAIEACSSSQAIIKILIDEKAEFGGWKYNSTVAAQSAVNSISVATPPVDKTEFSKNSSYYEEYGTYEEYLKEWKSALDDDLTVVKLMEYSVQNNIPTQAVQSSSSKGVYLTTLMSNIELIMYFAIVIAALIVANEFSSGSARLLFIRPHSRSKILLSKYATIMLLLVGLNLANVLISFAFTAIFNGFGDMFVPNLAINGGEIAESAAIWNYLGTIVLSNFRVVFVVSFAFMISTLFKKGALGIVLGILLDTLLSSIYSIVMLASDFAALKFTPIPYYMMEIFASSKVEYLISNMYASNLGTAVNSMYYPIASKLSIWGGLGNSIFWMGLCILAIFLPFRKQEIKN